MRSRQTQELDASMLRTLCFEQDNVLLNASQRRCRRKARALGTRLPCVAIAVLLGACVSTKNVVRSRFATEQDCPEDRVVVDEEGGTQYRARGCDKETTYVCGAVAGFRGGVQCVQENLPNPPGYRERDRPVLPPPDPRVPASP